MRDKKPWVRARLTLEGWYVRFMMGPTSYKKLPFCKICEFCDSYFWRLYKTTNFASQQAFKNKLPHDMQTRDESGKPTIIADFLSGATS